MKKAIHIDGKVDKGTVENIAEGIVGIMKAGFETHADQETIRHAINMFGENVAVSDITIANNVFTSQEDIKFKEGEGGNEG